jgi:hypothetical protein
MSSCHIIQRSGATGTIPVRGFAAGGVDIEARWNGGAWTTIATNVSGAYSGSFANVSGQGPVEIRIKNAPTIASTIRANTGIGDVFIVAGQSNAGGQGTNLQGYSHATLKAGLFGNDYIWRELVDPTDSIVNQYDAVSQDGNALGSAWPLLATLHMAATGVPCAFVPCALTSTAITLWLPGASHTDRATLYGSMVTRALLTGAKVVLWWQGETDAVNSMSQATYSGHLVTIANAVQADLGVKLMPCKLQNCSGATAPNQANINNAIGANWGVGNVLAGPDFTDIASDDAFHLKTDAKLLTAAQRWWAALQTAFGW